MQVYSSSIIYSEIYSILTIKMYVLTLFFELVIFKKRVYFFKARKAFQIRVLAPNFFPEEHAQ